VPPQPQSGTAERQVGSRARFGQNRQDQRLSCRKALHPVAQAVGLTRGHVRLAVVTDLKAFRRACYGAARRTGGELTELRISDKPTPNFHQAIIAYADRTVAVVCVRDSPLLALAVPRAIEFAPARESNPLTFLDLPDLAAALAQAAEFRLLTTAELDGPIDIAEWPGISRHDLRCWQPQTLGEGLFNYRD
jgi:hypothetical protein